MAGQVTDRISLFIAHWMGRVDARSGRNTKSADPDAVDSSDGSRWRLECGFPPVKIDPMPNQPSTPTQAVAVVGGGVAGSEIASKMAENGILVAVFERDRVAFGEPDGAVPFWHEERRRAERDTIVAKLSHPGDRVHSLHSCWQGARLSRSRRAKMEFHCRCLGKWSCLGPGA